MIALSLNGTASHSLTIADALTGPSLNALAKSDGRFMAIRWIGEEVKRAARLCGTDMEAEVIADVSEMIFDRFQFRTANALRLALRDGLNSGKIFGKLTYPLIAEWLAAHEVAVEAASYQRHIANK